ncbi:MAG: hypothetical protein WCH42_07505 [Actinomycetes bacterium]|jgi:hypothetical protein
MPDINNKFIVLTVTKDETHLWTTGVGKGSKPETISLPVKADRKHFRLDPNIKGSGEQHEEGIYLEEISQAIASAGEILLIGHGKGKGSEMLHLVSYLERKHPLIAAKVAGKLTSDLENMSEPEILALARRWFDQHHL